MSAQGLLLQHQRHLKWRALDPLERGLMAFCGLILFGFSSSVLADIVTRLLGWPWVSAQEVTDTCFIYGIFIGAAVATRRNDHLTLTAIADSLHGPARFVAEMLTRLVVLAVGVAMVVFGWENFLTGFNSFRMPSMTPIASLYAAIPISGLLIALFCIEQIVCGCRNGFDQPVGDAALHPVPGVVA